MRSFPRTSRARLALLATLLVSSFHAPAVGAAPRFQTLFSGQLANVSSLYFPVRLAVGDLNEDGNLDVVAPGALSGMAVELGRGDGTLAPPITVGPAPGSIAWMTLADFDGDGHLDIGEVTNSEAAIYFGDGTGQNWQRASLSVNGNALQVVACDVDADGRSDLVAVVNHMPPLGGPPNWDPPSLRSFLSRPGRTFAIVDDAQPLLNGTPHGFEARDLNGDGKIDLVLIDHAGSAAVCIGIGHGDGTFSFSGRNDVVGDAWGCDVRDADGDGKLDLIIAGSYGPTIDPGLGDGTFGAAQSFYQPGWYEGPRDAAVGDVTGDGVPDLVVSDYTYDGLVVRPGIGAGVYGPPLRRFLGCVFSPMELEDMNNDGALDVVGMSLRDDQNSNPPGVFIALGDGAGGFGAERPGVSYPNAGQSLFSLAGDFDGDGRPDLATFRQYPGPVAQVLHNDGARHFLPRPEFSLPEAVSLAFTADLDEDGHLDLVTAAASTRWFRGLGDGTFASPVVIAAGPLAIAVRDVTEDGHADVVFPLGGGVRILPGYGNGGFGSAFDLSLPFLNPGPLQVGDLDGDGHPDFAMVGMTSSFTTEQMVLHGPFFPAMPTVHEEWSAPNFGAQTVGDVDGDGHADLLDALGPTSYGWIGTVETRLHQADGTLGSPVLSNWPRSAMAALELADLDHDGHLDLLGLGDGGWYVGLGDGDGHFAIEGLEASGLSLSPFAVAPVDFDGDGRLDLVVNTYPAGVAGIEVCFGRDPVPPTVANVASQPGGPLSIGQSMTLGWTASDDVGLGTASAFVSRHGPNGPFEPIGTGPAGDETLPWTVTGPPADSITFKVVVRDLDGNTAWAKSTGFGTVAAPTAVGVAPAIARLEVIVPNPAHERLRFTLALPHAGRATLVLVDVQGRRVATLLDADLAAGTTSFDRPLPELRTGLYFARLVSGGEHAVARTVLTR